MQGCRLTSFEGLKSLVDFLGSGKAQLKVLAYLLYRHY
jgi:hypothetical protein